MATATNTQDAWYMNRDAAWLAAYGIHYFGTADSGKVHRPEYIGWRDGREVNQHRAHAACNPRTRLDGIHHVAYGDTISGDICGRCFREADGWEVAS